MEAKTQSVREALEHHGGFEKISIAPAIGANPIYRYRNKMEYSFSAQRWLTSDEIASGRAFDMSFALGLHVPGNFSKVLDLTECHLHSETGVRVVNFVRRFVRKKSGRRGTFGTIPGSCATSFFAAAMRRASSWSTW